MEIEQEMEINFLRGELINSRTRISFLLEAVKNLTHEKERQITKVHWDDWENSEVYAALKGDK